MSDKKDHTRTTAQIDSLNVSVRAVRFLGVLLELVLLAAVVYLFEIEERRHFFPVFCVVICGFCVHAWLPAEHRLAGFATLSIGTILFVLGLANGLWVLGIGSALIGVCYLPIRPGVRVLVLVVAGAGLVWMRTQRPFPFWPVLGSMFMFRLVIFVYDCRRSVERPSLASALSYFFLLPNVCFPLFPVIDYKTFRDTRYNEDEWEIYQRGVRWIVRGLVHLLLYRYIRTYVVPEPYQLYDVPHLALFMATNFSLYLHVSGQFHLITGLLHLFGFNLPRTHYLFFLASSFSDIWRRINIYWKDFMTKFFFFPTFFALRSRGAGVGPAIVLGVCCVFVGTWLLHSWQTFWLLGRFPVTVNDACLWLGVGACVAVNAVFDSRRGTRRKRSALLNAFSVSLRTVCMFALVSLFWACWTKPGFLYSLGGVLDRPEAGHGLLVVLMWMLAVVGLGTILAMLSRGKVFSVQWPATVSFRDSVALHAVVLGALAAVALPGFASLFPERTAQAIAEFRSDSSPGDAFSQMQSYYQTLNAAPIQAGPLLSTLSPRDPSGQAEAFEFEALTRPADPLLELELIPGIQGTLDGSPVSINQFGMRDRQTITLDKPPDTIRIALLGSSVVMGYGVGDEEVFSRLLETRLNSGRASDARRFEVLNFGVGKYFAIQRRVLLDRKVLAFQPDAVFYVAHQEELLFPARQLAELAANNTPLPYACLNDILDEAGVAPGMSPGRIAIPLQGRDEEILRCLYGSFVDTCREREILPVWIYVPIPEVKDAPPDPSPTLLPLAGEAGFVVLDLSPWAEGHKSTEFKVRADGQHPNAVGHQLITDELYRLLRRHPGALPRAE